MKIDQTNQKYEPQFYLSSQDTLIRNVAIELTESSLDITWRKKQQENTTHSKGKQVVRYLVFEVRVLRKDFSK